jgi:hypothetical protein
MVVEELRKLFAQAFIAHALMPGNDRVLENLLLRILGKLSPEMFDGLSQNKGEAGLGILLVRH